MSFGDAAARRTIREDLGATLVVEAAAGTGKTTEMIARIIAVVRTGTSTLARIVAVTFTERAAGEMKLRLRTELERARQAATGIEQARLVAALAELEVARIGTIHSFCADLLRERPIEARVDPLFQLAAEDQAGRLFQRAFDTWLEVTLAAPGEGVRRLLRRAAPTELLRRAGWSLVDRRDFAGAWRRDPFDRDASIDGRLVELATLAELAARADRPDDWLAKVLARLARWLAELGRRELVRPRDHDGLEAELAEVARWWEWKYSGRGTLYGAGLLRVDVVAQRDAVKSALEQMLQAADADLAACLREELRPLVHEYERLKSRSGELDFLDLLARTRDLLRDDARVRHEMQSRFTHFFVDEFQDTDPLQAEILLLLCAEDPALTALAQLRPRPGKLFAVGDPKQAIYRFRRADIALYESVKSQLVGQGARLLHLTTSFRSVPAIQSAVNAAFEPVMRGAGQAQYIPLERARDDAEGQPAVVALPVPRPYGKRRDITNVAIEVSYPDAVAAFVEWLTTASGWTVSERGGAQRVPIAPRHVGLVFRRFQSFGSDLTRAYAGALEARGLPHVLIGGRSFHAREEVEAMRNALAAIEWPDDELAVYATLRGPFFGFHDEDLVAFKHLHHRLRPLAWLGERGRAAQAALATETGQAVAVALAILGELHRRRNRRSIADTLARLLAATRAHAGLAVWPAGEQALANVFRVLDVARRFEAAGAISFRAFVERLASDADHGRHADAPVIEDGTDGVRMMTVHAAKGLEFPVVILCDPTAPLAQERPSRHIDIARGVWLEPLAGCVPSELREHAAEVRRRDREEGERLTYVAVTRARDLLVVPVVGDEERGGWLEPLTPVVYPHPAQKRRPEAAPGCPPFGDDSVDLRSRDSDRMPMDSVAPGRHAPRVGSHGVVWWDPGALALDRVAGGGIRQQQILRADESRVVATAGEAAHAAWQARRAAALAAGSVPSLVVQTVTAMSQGSPPASLDAIVVTVETTRRVSSTRPRGKRFGSLVHAVLAAVELRGDVAHITAVAANHARLMGAPAAELAAAIVAVGDALAHPLLVRAAAAHDRRALRRETPVVLALAAPPGGGASARGSAALLDPAAPPGGGASARGSAALLEGIVDLAFGEPTSAGGQHWTVIDFKTDLDLGAARAAYETQVRAYARAIMAATGYPTTGVLLLV